MTNLRVKLEETIQKKHMLAHPWYVRWQSGQLSREELQGYAKEYYPFESEFPRFLSHMHAKCTNPEMRQDILSNLNDEEQGEDNHPELWLRFADGLGIDRNEVKNHFRSDETEHLVRTFRKHATSENPIDGLAALYAYERQQPDVARTKMEGLKTFYNCGDDRTISFFKAHQHYDVAHAENEVSWLVKLCDTPEAEERAVKVVEETLGVLYDFLDGVERRYRPIQ